MRKRAEDLAKQLYPNPKLENYDDILVYRADRDNAIMGRVNVVRVYEQAEKDLGWHSVDKSLPPVDEEVIVLTDIIAEDSIKIGLGRICFAHIVNPDLTVDIDGKPYKVVSHNGWNVPGVKFWMPMPKLPKEEEQ